MMTDGEKGRMEVSLREYVEAMMSERDRRYELSLDASRELVESTRIDLERRLQTLNELRTAVERDRSQFVPSIVYAERTKGYDQFCAITNDRLMRMETERTTLLAMVGSVISVGLSLIAIAVQFWK